MILGSAYRFVERRYASLSYDGEYGGSYDLRVRLSIIDIVKRTPKGFWVTRYQYPGCEALRFVRANAKKRFACETIEDAAESFRRRKLRQIEILEARLRDAKEALSRIEHMIRYESYEHD